MNISTQFKPFSTLFTPKTICINRVLVSRSLLNRGLSECSDLSFSKAIIFWISVVVHESRPSDSLLCWIKISFLQRIALTLQSDNHLTESVSKSSLKTTSIPFLKKKIKNSLIITNEAEFFFLNTLKCKITIISDYSINGWNNQYSHLKMSAGDNPHYIFSRRPMFDFGGQ